MIARWDFGITLVFAAGLHVAGFGYFATGATDNGAGAEGVSIVTLAPSSDHYVELVAKWDQVPEAAQSLRELAQPVLQEATRGPAVSEDSLVSNQTPVHPKVPEFSTAPERASLDLPSLTEPTFDTPLDTQPATLTAAPTKVAPSPMAWVAPEQRLAIGEMVPPVVPDFAVLESPRPIERPDRNTPAPALVARGVGSGATTGQLGGSSGNATVPAVLVQAAHAEWAGAIQSRIARHQRYPRGARGEGRVRLRMTIGTDGRLGGVVVDRSSGSARFDRAALRAAEAAAPYPAAPHELRKSAYVFAQWVSFAR